MAVYTCVVSGRHGPEYVEVDPESPGIYAGETLTCWIEADGETEGGHARPIAFSAGGTDPDPDPEPTDPQPPAASSAGQAVADFLGSGDDPGFVTLCGQHAAIVTALARSYCRGGGFTPDGPREDVAAVITTASARMVANPEQSTIQAGEVSGRDRGFQGWNLAELAVLNRYRGRAA